ncbi:hypothetical protein PTKIN_Ptkin15bG0145600 [Pterospermum kingtungense]
MIRLQLRIFCNYLQINATLNLLEDAKVGSILGAQTSLEAKFLAEFEDRNKIPVISFSSTPSSFPIFSAKSRFLVQIRDGQTSQIKGVAALIGLYKWRKVILIGQENYDLDSDNDGAMSHMTAFLEEKNIHISFVSTIDGSSEDDEIIEQLHELKTLQTNVFIVHLSHSLGSQLFVHEKRLGLINKGLAPVVRKSWLRPWLNLRLLDYDVAWSLAKAAARELLCGEFRFINGKLISNKFEIVNVMSSGEKRVGFCTSTGKFTREIYETDHRRQLSDIANNLESISWPGGSLTIPQGRMLQTNGKILRIGVPVARYPQLVEVTHDPSTNAY